MSGAGSPSSSAAQFAGIRVAIVSPNPPGFVGGVERSCALLASVLEARGARVTVVWPRYDVKRWVYRVGLGSLGRSRRMAADPRLADVDAVITSGIFGWSFAVSVPRIHVFHGTIVEMTRAEAAGLSPSERRLARLPWRERLRRRWGGGAAEALAGRNAAIVCVSESTGEEIRRHYRLRPDAIIPNGIDLGVFAPRPRNEARAALGLRVDERLALFAGRLNLSKGEAIMERACERSGYRLLIAGPTGARGALNLGVLEPQVLAMAYAAADCVLLPSLYEACSYVALEALSCGVPLVSTRVGSIPTLLRALPEYAALCVRHDEADLAAKLDYLRRTDTAALTERARAWVAEQNSLERYSQRWASLLSSVL